MASLDFRSSSANLCPKLTSSKMVRIFAMVLSQYIVLLSVAVVHAAILPLPSRSLSTHEDLDPYVPNPEADYNATQLIEYYGYPAEVYDVQTSDGYILTVQRIPHGHDEIGVPYTQGVANNNNNKTVVFLQHGLLAAADCYLLNPAQENLATLLADAGFDVWLGNFRGNVYSQRHAWLDPKSRDFWRFSWDEMGKIDLPTMLGKVLEVTGQKDVIYIGHSEGTTAAWVALSTNETFASQIKLMVALAPIAYVKHIKSPVMVLAAKFSRDLDFLFNIFGYEDFAAENKFTRALIDKICSDMGDIPALLCEDTFFILMGFDSYEFNRSRNDVYLNHVPAGTSSQNVFHYAQCMETGNFQAYDFGNPLKNFKHYGQFKPPQYLPQNIKTPVALITASNDWLSVQPDVDRLKSELQNVVYEYHVPFPYWNHVDYVMGLDAKTFYITELINFVVNFNGTAKITTAEQ